MGGNFYVIARHYKIGDPAGYFVPVGKRNKQAKDKQTIEMSLFGQ